MGFFARIYWWVRVQNTGKSPAFYNILSYIYSVVIWYTFHPDKLLTKTSTWSVPAWNSWNRLRTLDR